MKINTKLTKIKQQKVKQVAQKTDSYSFFNLLTSPALFDIVEGMLPEHRERQFPPTETLSMFLAQAMDEDRSCQHAVNSAAVKRIKYGLPKMSTSTSAYCRARKRLPTDMIAALVRYTSEAVYDQLPDRWLWKKRRICMVDGTTFTLPDTVENQACFPQSGGQKAGLGFPLCRMVGLFCLTTGALLDAAYGKTKGKGSTEQGLVREIAGALKPGDILLGDAFYSTYFFLAWLAENKIDAVFEQHGSRQQVVDFRKGKRLGHRDHIIEYSKPKKPDWMSEQDYVDAPEKIEIREIKVGGKVLITTLLNPQETKKVELKLLYKERWHVELNFRHIKSSLGMDRLTCKTPEMVEKELWVYLLAYNLIRVLMSESAQLKDLLPIQLSFKHSMQLWQSWIKQDVGVTTENLVQLFSLMAQRRVSNRPGRIEPRAVKRRPKATPLLTKKRSEARADIIKNYLKAA